MQTLKHQTLFGLDIFQEKVCRPKRLNTARTKIHAWVQPTFFPGASPWCCIFKSFEHFQVAHVSIMKRPTQLSSDSWSSFSSLTGSVDYDAQGGQSAACLWTRVSICSEAVSHNKPLSDQRVQTQPQPTVNTGRHPTQAVHVQNITCNSKVVENSFSSDCLPGSTLQNV